MHGAQTDSDRVGARRPAVTDGVVVVTRQSTVQIAGLSVLQRTIFALERAGVHSIMLIPRTPADESLVLPRTRLSGTHLRWCRGADLPEAIGGNALLVLGPVVLTPTAIEALGTLVDAPDPALALQFADRTGNLMPTGCYLVAGRSLAEVTRVLLDAIDGSNGQAAFNYYPSAKLPSGVCYPLGPGASAAEIRTAENMLLGSLRKSTDGFIAYWFDRRISAAISRYLVRTRVTPNQISVFTLVPALAGAMLLAMPGRLLSGLGAILYLLSTILDGCDGEVARLKYLESAKGARLDLVCDRVGLVALFLAIIVHVHAEVAGATLWYAGGVLIGGMIFGQIIENFIITQPRTGGGGGAAPLTSRDIKNRELYERLASRDFAYLLPVLAFTGTLSWLVWATAVGVNIFWLGLVAIAVRKPSANQS